MLTKLCRHAEIDSETGLRRCKTTGYYCRYIKSDPRQMNPPCLFDPIFSRCKQMQQMIASIRAVQIGSRVTVLYRTSYGWGGRTVIESSHGEVLSIDGYGDMKIDVNAFKIPMTYKPYDFKRNLFLNRDEMESKLQQLQDEADEEERIKAERREEDGRIGIDD